jgi:hypothetical protein
VDWLQNVLAAGPATAAAGGETHDVTEPEVIDAATALPMLSPRRRRTFERVGIAQFLKVKLASSRWEAAPRSPDLPHTLPDDEMTRGGGWAAPWLAE